MKRTFWKLCILLIALTMILTAGAFAEGMIGLTALGLYGLSTLCGMQWACLRLQQEDEAALRAAQARRAARMARRRAAPVCGKEEPTRKTARPEEGAADAAA